MVEWIICRSEKKTISLLFSCWRTKRKRKSCYSL